MRQRSAAPWNARLRRRGEEIVLGKFLTIWVYSALPAQSAWDQHLALRGVCRTAALIAALAWCVVYRSAGGVFSAPAWRQRVRATFEGRPILSGTALRADDATHLLTLARACAQSALQLDPVTGVARWWQLMTGGRIPGCYVPSSRPIAAIAGWRRAAGIAQFNREVLFREAERLVIAAAQSLFRGKGRCRPRGGRFLPSRS